jgi:hypothetical protein
MAPKAMESSHGPTNRAQIERVWQTNGQVASIAPPTQPLPFGAVRNEFPLPDSFPLAGVHFWQKVASRRRSPIRDLMRHSTPETAGTAKVRGIRARHHILCVGCG